MLGDNILTLGKESKDKKEYKTNGIVKLIKNILYKDITKPIKIESENNNIKNGNNNYTKNIESNTIICPITKQIISGIDICIENDNDNIDTQYLEDYYPECNINDYVNFYRKLLKGIKEFLIKNQYNANDINKKNLLMNIKEIEIRKEIKIDRIPMFLELILKYYNIGFEGYIVVEDIVNICMKTKKTIETPGIKFLEQMIKEV